MNHLSIAAEIIRMKNNDLEVRQRLAESGALYEGYNSEMERIHIRNAKRLGEIMDIVGWPSAAKVGREARDAAMVIVQHAISLPDFQRLCLNHIQNAVEKGEEERRNYAFLYDRICFNERRPQRFGTQYDWDEQGQMSPWTLENPEMVDVWREEYGLNPIMEETAAVREGVSQSGERPPADYNARQREIREWCVKTGWI